MKNIQRQEKQNLNTKSYVFRCGGLSVFICFRPPLATAFLNFCLFAVEKIEKGECFNKQASLSPQFEINYSTPNKTISKIHIRGLEKVLKNYPDFFECVRTLSTLCAPIYLTLWVSAAFCALFIFFLAVGATIAITVLQCIGTRAYFGAYLG